MSGYFEDIDKGTRKPLKPEGFNEEDGFVFNDEPSEESITKLLEGRFGKGNVGVKKIGTRELFATRKKKPDMSMSKNDRQGLLESIAYIADKAKIPNSCVDAIDRQIKVGDILATDDGAKKKVIQVGWKFAELSKVEDHTKTDGVWFEHEIATMGFTIEKKVKKTSKK